MDGDQIKDMVRSRYAEIAVGSAGCCGSAATPEEASCNMGYSEAELASVPEGANLGLGCGNPQALAAVQPVRSSSISAAAPGSIAFSQPSGSVDGRVIGVDMTHEMRRKPATTPRGRGGKCRVPLGEIEHLPIGDDTADVVISNCVINLVPDKDQVYREAFRVLKPGGRIAISDVVNLAPLPAELATDEALLCGCVAGAAASGQIEQWLAAAGFVEIRISVKPESRELVKTWAPGRGIEDYVASAAIEARKPRSAAA